MQSPDPAMVRMRTLPVRPRLAGGRRLRRAVLVTVAFCASLLFFLFIAGGLTFLTLLSGPLDVDLGHRIATALDRRVGGGYAFSVGTTVVESGEHGPNLVIRQLTVKDRTGRIVMSAPRAGVSVDLMSLAVGTVSPKRLEVQDIVLRVVRLEDGRIAMTAGQDEAAISGAFAGPIEHGALPDGVQAGPASRPAEARPGGGRATAMTSRALTDLVAAFVNAAFDSDSPFRGLDRFGISRGTLVVEDRLRGTSMTYRNFAVDLDRTGEGSVFLNAGADGPAGHWSTSARVGRSSTGQRSVDLAVDHLTTDELMLIRGARQAGFETDMPLSAHVALQVGPDGVLNRADGRLSFGAGYFRLDDPDHEPAMVDGIDAALRLDPANGEIEVGDGVLKADQTTFRFGLRLVPPAGGAEPWGLTGNASGSFGPERPAEQPILMDAIRLEGQVFGDGSHVVLKAFTVKGPEVSFRMDADFRRSDTGFLLTSSMETGRMPAQVVIRLWPNWVAAAPRAWFLRNLRGGTLDYGKGSFSLTDVDLEKMKRQHSPPDDHARIEFGVLNGGLAFMNGMPPLQGLEGVGVITGDTLTFAARKAELEVSPGHRLQLNEGTFTIPSTDPKPSPAVIGLHVTGSVATLAELLGRDALKPYVDLPIDSKDVAGDVDGRLTINLKLGDHVNTDETRIGVTATAKNFSAANVIGKETLDGATLSIVADRASLHASGAGRLFGAPATIDVKKQSGGGPSEAVLGMTLDDAARAKAGFGFGRSVTGPVAVKLSTSLPSADKARAAVELDFSKAAFDAPLPGLKKAAGKPARATFTVSQTPTQIGLDQIAFESGATVIRGSAALDGNGGFQSAKLSQLRLSPGDDMRVDASQTGDGLKLTVRGSSVDARPFLKSVTSGDSGPSGASSGKDLDLDLHANLLTGQNGQAMANADLRLSRRGGQFRRVQMAGRLGKGAASVSTSGQGAAATIGVDARDAGAVLSFLDLYKRMDGGRLQATLRQADGRLDGVATIHDFTIREDPAIKKLAQEQIPTDSQNAGAKIDTSAVPFTKLEASFSRVGNKVEVRDGSMYGPQVGATVAGTIDFARDRVALNGTFVPIYGLNNLFSQIPVVGLLLGGGSHEGLFALNYRIDGPASAPVLTFNPLSALAPGFLRKIFGAIDSAAQQGGEPAAAGSVRDHAVGPGSPTPE